MNIQPIETRLDLTTIGADNAVFRKDLVIFDRMQLIEWENEQLQTTVRRIETKVATREVIQETVAIDCPDGRWAAFKMAVLPKWLLRKFPVKQKVIKWTRSYWFPTAPAVLDGHDEIRLACFPWMNDAVPHDRVDQDEGEAP